VDHFVREHPVVIQLGRSGFAAHANLDESAAKRKGLPVADAAPAHWDDPQPGVRNRIAAVVGRYGFRGLLYPVHQVVVGNLQVSRFNDHVDAGAAHQDGGSHIVRPCRKTGQQQHDRTELEVV
jgi:hypothetical protein